MWNYSFIVPCALMMFTLLGFYFSRPRPPLRFNRVFLGLLVIELAVLLADVVSTRVDEMYESFSPTVLYIANTAFFSLFVLRVFWFYRFTLELLHASSAKRPRWLWVTMVPFAISEAICLTSFATSAVFSVQDGAYVSGPLYGILAYTYYLYEWLSIALVLTNAKHLKRHDLICAYTFNLVLFAGSVIRVMLPHLLVMDTFCMVAITIIYLAFLNPDLYLSEHSPAFNMKSFRMVLSEPERQTDGHLLGFALQNYNHERSILGSRQMDEILTLVSEYLGRTFPDEIPFYLRSGRFALVGRGPDKGDELSQAIQKRFQEPWQIEGAALRLNVSFAYIDTNSPFKSADRVMNNLVIALDNVKRSPLTGTERALGEPLDMQQVDEQVDILRLLERALENDHVEVFLQPLINSRSRVMEGVEALARIRDDKGQLVSPGLFIPVAEKSGYIIELGRQVLRKTCAFVRDHDLGALGIRWVNVNLSPIQCMQQDVAQQFSHILAEYGVAPDLIHLEITEQSIVDFTMLQRQISSLEDEGFVFVLDDYGTGFSNLTRVKRYPFSTIKLDMEIVWDYFHDRDDLLPSIVSGFKATGLTITAEGIESEEMADALTAIGSDYLQGFYFSKPLPVDEFARTYELSAIA